MKDDNLMRRLRAARPVAAEPGNHDALFARIVADAGDPRLLEAPHAGSSRFLGATARPWTRARPRVVAGSTLGLAGVAALVLALSGSTAPPAFAITTNGDGSVLVNINRLESLPDANHKLTAMGIHEQITIFMAPGAAPASGPVNCVPQGANVPGPPVKAIVGTNGTELIPSGNTGGGTWHMASCRLYATRTTGGNPLYGENPSARGNTGNSGTAGAG
jgi:hypothetical protein